ncbi:AraC family transcriptional regulator [Lachnospiraceae bacterium OttesenSCG-928-D06]|nr:AraC family transcriptional regulator [Lachnospiraceae bacterium OttesenSCG-928-D06]
MAAKKNTRYTSLNKKTLSKEAIVLVSILAVILLTLAITFYAITNNTNSLLNNLNEVVDEQLSIVTEQTSSQISSYLNMCSTLSINYNLRSYAESSSENKEYMITEGFNVQKALCSLISLYGKEINTVAAYFPNSKTIVTMARYLEQDEIHTFFDMYPEVSSDQLDSLPLSQTSNNIFIFEGGHHWIVYKTFNPISYILVEFNPVFIVDDSNNNFEDILIMIGDDNTCIYSNRENITDEDYQTAYSSNDFSIHNSSYSSKRTAITGTGLFVISGLPISHISETKLLLTSIIIIVAIILLLCIALTIIHLTRTIFTPLNHLFHMTGHSGNSTKEILYSLADEIIERENNQKLLVKERDMLHPLALGRSLTNLNASPSGKRSIAYAKSCLLLAGLTPGRGYSMFSIVFTNNKQDILKQLELEKDSEADLLLYYLTQELDTLLFAAHPGSIAPIQEGSYAVIVSCPNQDMLNQINDARQALLKKCESEFKTIPITTQAVYGSSISEFEHSARILIRNISFIKFWSVEDWTSDETTENMSISSYTKLITQFLNRLNAGNYEQISNELDNFIKQTIPSDVDNFHTAKHRVYALSAIITTILRDQFINDQEFFESLNCDERLQYIENIADFQYLLKDILSSVIARKTEHNQVTSTSKRMEDIKQYIMSHFRESGMSLSSVAEQFNISPPHLSRSFKEAYNTNVLEYIHILRVNEAKRLLAKNMTIQAVAHEVGFWDTQGLTRVFKKYEGINPGEYKRILSNDNND